MNSSQWNACIADILSFMGGYHGVPRLIYIIVSDTEAYDLHEHLYVTATHRDLCADTFLHFVTASNFLYFAVLLTKHKPIILWWDVINRRTDRVDRYSGIINRMQII